MSKIYRLGVLADTHFTELSTSIELARQLGEGPFSNVDAILHAGDMIIPDFENCFGDLPFYSVQGNMDASRVDLPIKRIIVVASYRIGLIHGWGAPSQVPQNVLTEFSADGVDAIVFGHSHTPFHAMVGDTLLFNPGSATDHRDHAPDCSVGLIELGSKLTAEHIYL